MYNYKWFAEVHHVLVAWHVRSLPACVHFVWQDATIVEAIVHIHTVSKGTHVHCIEVL